MGFVCFGSPLKFPDLHRVTSVWSPGAVQGWSLGGGVRGREDWVMARLWGGGPAVLSPNWGVLERGQISWEGHCVAGRWEHSSGDGSGGDGVQTGALKATETYSPRVLETRSPSSRCPQGHALSVEGRILPASSSSGSFRPPSASSAPRSVAVVSASSVAGGVPLVCPRGLCLAESLRFLAHLCQWDGVLVCFCRFYWRSSLSPS